MLESSPLTPCLIADPNNGNGIDHEFLLEAVSRFSEDDMVKSAFITAMEDLSHQIRKMNMSDNYQPHVAVSRLADTITHSLTSLLLYRRYGDLFSTLRLSTRLSNLHHFFPLASKLRKSRQ